MIALPGSLGDLVARAQGRPIYCAAPLFIRPAIIRILVNSFRRAFPNATFVDGRSLYQSSDEWRRRWWAERDRYGAGIVMTRAEGRPKDTDPFDGLTGEHIVGTGVVVEIQSLIHLDRPVGWHAIVFPARYWLSRFAVEPLPEMKSSRYARLLPHADADLLYPTIWPPFHTVSKDE